MAEALILAGEGGDRCRAAAEALAGGHADSKLLRKLYPQMQRAPSAAAQLRAAAPEGHEVRQGVRARARARPAGHRIGGAPADADYVGRGTSSADSASVVRAITRGAILRSSRRPPSSGWRRRSRQLHVFSGGSNSAWFCGATRTLLSRSRTWVGRPPSPRYTRPRPSPGCPGRWSRCSRRPRCRRAPCARHGTWWRAAPTPSRARPASSAATGRSVRRSAWRKKNSTYERALGRTSQPCASSRRSRITC